MSIKPYWSNSRFHSRSTEHGVTLVAHNPVSPPSHDTSLLWMVLLHQEARDLMVDSVYQFPSLCTFLCILSNMVTWRTVLTLKYWIHLFISAPSQSFSQFNRNILSAIHISGLFLVQPVWLWPRWWSERQRVTKPSAIPLGYISKVWSSNSCRKMLLFTNIKVIS